jgi:hypothetical protein
MLTSLAVDGRAPDASRALALRVLRDRAAESVTPASDLPSARAGAVRRREALQRVEGWTRAVLGSVDTSPWLRRTVLQDSGSLALAERARVLALHGLFDDAAGLLALDDPGDVAGWRARAARARVDGEEERLDALQVASPGAVDVPPPTADGPTTFALELTLGADTEAADHAAAVVQALVALLRAHPHVERAAWVRAVALHPSVVSTPDATDGRAAGDDTHDLEAVLMGRPGSTVARAWLALQLAEASEVAARAHVSVDGTTLWVQVGAEGVTLRPGAAPAPYEPPLDGIVAVPGARGMDVLVILGRVQRDVAACMNLPSRDAARAAGTSGFVAPVEASRTLAALGERWPAAPGLRALQEAALERACVAHGPWRDTSRGGPP